MDGILVENYGDAPFVPDRVPPETVAGMAVVTRALVRTVAEPHGLPIGVNVLCNDAAAARAGREKCRRRPGPGAGGRVSARSRGRAAGRTFSVPAPAPAAAAVAALCWVGFVPLTEHTGMPLYEYACRECGQRFETMRKVSERLDAPACPECGAAKTALALSMPGLVGAGAARSSGSASSAGESCGLGGGCCGGSCMN